MLERDDTIRRALAAIRDVGGTIDVEAFARLVLKPSKAKPSGRRSAAAGMLGRMRACCLVERLDKGVYRLTQQGMVVLNSPPWTAPPAPQRPVPPAPLVPVWTPHGWQWAAAPNGGGAPSAPDQVTPSPLPWWPPR